MRQALLKRRKIARVFHLLRIHVIDDRRVHVRIVKMGLGYVYLFDEIEKEAQKLFPVSKLDKKSKKAAK